MPRLPPALVLRARKTSPLIAKLLLECRDVESATNELRWLKEHASGGSGKASRTANLAVQARVEARRLISYVRRRSRGEPLQYILGNQPFGVLEVLCRKHVLIPRPETEIYTTMVAELLKQAGETNAFDQKTTLRIADFCTGTGCISLLLHSLLYPVKTGKSRHDRAQSLEIQGFDISPDALKLANDNITHNIEHGALHTSASHDITFRHLNVLSLSRKIVSKDLDETASMFLAQNWDVIISNPPYISPSDYAPGGSTTRSVRDFEPKLALVPPPVAQEENGSRSVLNVNMTGLKVEQADQFYFAILQIARRVGTKLIVMEIGDSAQAHRVREMVRQVMFEEDFVLETWRDDGSIDNYRPDAAGCPVDSSLSSSERCTNRSHERAVVIWRSSFIKWRTSNLSIK